MASVFTPAHALSQQELIDKLQSAGYSQIRNAKSTAEGTSVKATKDGKEVSLVVDSNGQFQEQPESGGSSATTSPQLSPVQPERTPRQAEQLRDRERRSAGDVQVGRDWKAKERYSDRMDERHMGRTEDDDDWGHRTVGRNRPMQSDDERSYYDEDRPRFRIKICKEYENGDEFCHYRNRD
ncbi:hypothetical protein ACQPTN_23940 [Bradyrhizobium sp. 13971]